MRLSATSRGPFTPTGFLSCFFLASVLLTSSVFLSGCSRSSTSPTERGEREAVADSTATEQPAGFPRVAGKYTVLGILTDNQDNSKAKENAESTLIRHPNVACLVGLWSQNTPMILAALRSSDAVGD